MTLLVAGMIDPRLPRDFLSSAADGDLLEAALALASVFALRSNWSLAIPMVWVANTWGFLGLLNGLRSVVQLNVPSFNLGTLWYVYTFHAPLANCSGRASTAGDRSGSVRDERPRLCRVCQPMGWRFLWQG